MEDQKGAAVRASSSSSSSAAAVAAPAPPPPLPALAPPPPAPPQSSSSSDVAAAAAAPKEEPLPPADGGQRVRFSVELKPGETTIVSWKRLLKESNKGGGSLPIASVAERPLAVQVGTGGPVGFPHLHQFSFSFPPSSCLIVLANFRVCPVCKVLSLLPFGWLTFVDLVMVFAMCYLTSMAYAISSNWFNIARSFK